MLKFLFVISFGFGIPTKYSDSLKCNHGVQSSLIGDLLVCHYFHGTQAQWSKGAQGFQACLDLALRFWFLNLREVGLGTILSYGLRTIWILCTYIYIYTIYTNLYPSVLHLFAPVSLFHADRFFIGRDHWNHGDTMEWIESSGSPTLESGDT